MTDFMATCPNCDELFDDEEEWFEHVSGGECYDEEPCSFCLERGCNGECSGDDMMGG